MIRPLALSLLFGLALAKNYTISGISSGGFMTAQLHVIYSNYADGAAIVAGGPYYCAMGKLSAAINQCTDQASLINVQSLVDFTNYQASIGNIDPVSGLANDKVYIFSGTNDKVVYPGVVNTTYLFYKHFIPEAQIVTNFTSPAEHAWITDNFLNNCTYLGPPWINNCNFDLADTVLTLFYGTLTPKVTAVPSNLRTFSQVPFAKGSGMAPLGFIYVPTGCDANCKLHVSFHGCSQNYLDIGNQYVINSGLNEWAEANSIIVLYPQTLNDNGKNPGGCWDFWGYTNAFYMTHEGLQVSAVWSMTQNISSIINQ